MKSECDKAFDLLSARLDGEAGAEEIKWLGDHLAGCPDCRRYETFLDGFNRQLQGKSAPSRRSGVFDPGGKRTRRLAMFLIPAACLLLGFAIGSARRPIPLAVAMSSRVAIPTGWSQAEEPGRRAAAYAAGPVAERIEWYQATIAEELSRESVDWMKVRVLVEGLNSWRTELELLTIHTLYGERLLSPGSGSGGSAWFALLGDMQKELF